MPAAPSSDARFVNMFVPVRAVIYAALFISFVLVYLPARFLSWSGIVEPASTGAPQVSGMIMVTIGTAIALWCVFTFVFIGKGTPARVRVESQRSTSNFQRPMIQRRGQRPAATVFLFPTLISSTAVEQESAERGVPCGAQGEHGGQCYEAANATGAEP